MKRVNKKLILICFSIVVTLGLTTFFVLNFSETNSEQVSDSVAEQDAENFSLKELSAEEKIYKELIGNLYDEINDLEKEKVQNLIKEIVKMMIMILQRKLIFIKTLLKYLTKLL